MSETPTRSKKLLPLTIAVAISIGIAVWFLQPDDETLSTPEVAEPTSGERQPPNPKFPTVRNVTDASVSKRAFADYGALSKSAADDLKIVDGLIKRFYLIAKDQADRFPMGTNREVTRVLAGHNPMKRAWISADHPAVDEHGELNDRWETPLHFHALARGVFEIRSAGPDREIFTEDDIVHGKNRVAQQIFTTVSEGAGTQPVEDN